LPFVITKNEFPNNKKSTPNGWLGSSLMGVPSCNVNEPPAPIDTIWLAEKGGAKGVTAPPLVGAPSAAFAFVKLDAKPVPWSYAITEAPNCPRLIRATPNTPAAASASTNTFLFITDLSICPPSGRFMLERPERRLEGRGSQEEPHPRRRG